MAETVAGGPAESELEEAVQALSAAAITVSKSAERLLVIAVTIEGLSERRNTHLHKIVGGGVGEKSLEFEAELG